MKSRLRRNESIDNITNQEMFEIMKDTKALIDEDNDRIEDGVFTTHYSKYPVKKFGFYTVVSYDTYKDICKDIVRHLKYALGDGISDFFNDDEYFEYMLKEPAYVEIATSFIERVDFDLYDTVKEVIDKFDYDGNTYIIFEKG